MSSDAPSTTAAGVARATSSWFGLLRAMRPYQWPKNGIVFAALVFSAGGAWHPSDRDSWWPLLWHSAALFGAWCLAASAIYLVNDVLDRGVDRLHPRKRNRPIAAGVVAPGNALVTAAVLALGAILAAVMIDRTAGGILGGYVVVMIAYSAELKRVAILDVLILCGGFVARAAAGAWAIGVEISPWLYVCTSFAAFFFASSKRWAEYRQLGADAVAHRPSLAGYSGEILSQLVVISASTALLAYALYTIESVNVPANGAMALTIPFVAFGLFRYLLLLNGERRADAPDQILFTDRQILASLGGFVVTALLVLLTN